MLTHGQREHHEQPASPPPSPERLFGMMNAYQQTAALRAAIELDLFSAIGRGKHTADEIARHCQAPVRGIRILCDFLVVAHVLDKTDDRYDLTAEAAFFLDAASPAYMGGAVHFILDHRMLANFDDLAATIRRGHTNQGHITQAEDPIWQQFARHMAPLMHMPAQALAKLVTAQHAGPMRILDVAAGHGLFGLHLLQANPEAHVTAVDWPGVLAIARENVSRAGVVERWQARPGSAFEVDLGEGYDVVLLTNFLHHFDEETNVAFLRRVRAALADGGRVVTLEFVPDESRVSPPSAAAFSLTMLANTEGGDAYPFSALQAMFRTAGLPHSTLHELPPTFSRVVVSQA